jgi:hypothetical protein
MKVRRERTFWASDGDQMVAVTGGYLVARRESLALRAKPDELQTARERQTSVGMYQREIKASIRRGYAVSLHLKIQAQLHALAQNEVQLRQIKMMQRGTREWQFRMCRMSPNSCHKKFTWN